MVKFWIAFFAFLSTLCRAADNGAQSLEVLSNIGLETARQFEEDAKARRKVNAIANRRELATIKAAD